MLDVKRLRILREVASQGSFSAAGDALFLSQSAVSQQIATLEREVGMQLLDRTREGPKLTDAGRVLVAHAEAAIARLDEAERELAAIAGLEGGELRLASFPSASATILTEAVSIFHRRHPAVRLSVADAEPEESLPRLRAGELDLALTFDYPSVPKPEERDLEQTLVLSESMHLALPKNHPLADAAGRPAGRVLRDRVALRVAPSTCGEVVLARLPQRGLRAADRVRVRRLQRHAGVHRRRARGHPAARPGAREPASRPRRPADRPAGAGAPGLGGQPSRGVPARRRPRRWSRSWSRSAPPTRSAPAN